VWFFFFRHHRRKPAGCGTWLAVALITAELEWAPGLLAWTFRVMLGTAAVLAAASLRRKHRAAGGKA
jgi:hypothetical protein